MTNDFNFTDAIMECNPPTSEEIQGAYEPLFNKYMIFRNGTLLFSSMFILSTGMTIMSETLTLFESNATYISAATLLLTIIYFAIARATRDEMRPLTKVKTKGMFQKTSSEKIKQYMSKMEESGRENLIYGEILVFEDITLEKKPWQVPEND